MGSNLALGITILVFMEVMISHVGKYFSHDSCCILCKIACSYLPYIYLLCNADRYIIYADYVLYAEQILHVILVCNVIVFQI